LVLPFSQIGLTFFRLEKQAGRRFTPGLLFSRSRRLISGGFFLRARALASSAVSRRRGHLGTNMLGAGYLTSLAEERFMSRSTRRRELKMALAISLGLAAVCYGAAVFAASLLR
jgi:hypothetical protein